MRTAPKQRARQASINNGHGVKAGLPRHVGMHFNVFKVGKGRTLALAYPNAPLFTDSIGINNNVYTTHSYGKLRWS